MRKLLLALILSLLVAPATTFAFSIKDTGLEETGGAVYAADKDVGIGEFLANNVVTPLFAIAGAIYFVLLVYVGILWMIDQGNSENVKKAKSILVYSTIGLVVLVSAYAISDYILRALSSAGSAEAAMNFNQINIG